MAVSVFKTACDPPHVGLGGFDSHALPPHHPGSTFALRSFVLRSSLRSASLVVGVACLTAASSPVAAQIDTVIAPLAAPVADTLRPPITPKRAFFYSLLAPGSAQNILGRNRAAAALLGVETMSIAMLRESAADLREARRQLGDSIVMSYVDDKGALLPKPLLARRRFDSPEVQSRRSHVEDWIALLVANHLFAAADAFVAASLWDVNAHLAVGGDRAHLRLVGRISW